MKCVMDICVKCGVSERVAYAILWEIMGSDEPAQKINDTVCGLQRVLHEMEGEV